MYSRAEEAIQRIKERRPKSFTLGEVDAELTCMVIVRALSDKPSCSVLVSMLLHNEDKLTDVTKLKDELIMEDISRNTTPALYGLRKTAEGVLRAAEHANAAGIAPNAAAKAPAAANAAGSRRSRPAASVESAVGKEQTS